MHLLNRMNTFSFLKKKKQLWRSISLREITELYWIPSAKSVQSYFLSFVQPETTLNIKQWFSHLAVALSTMENLV